MGDSDLPAEISNFLGRYVESVVQLEVLLLLQARPTARLSAAEVAAELRIDPAGAETQLAKLRADGLLARSDETPTRYTYSPSRPEIGEVIDRLSNAYIDRRVSVIGLIYSKPTDKLQIFADAFRIRKEDK